MFKATYLFGGREAQANAFERWCNRKRNALGDPGLVTRLLLYLSVKTTCREGGNNCKLVRTGELNRQIDVAKLTHNAAHCRIKTGVIFVKRGRAIDVKEQFSFTTESKDILPVTPLACMLER